MRVTEKRFIDFEKVRNYCIANNLYELGTNEDYNNLLLNLCRRDKEIKTNDLIMIAENILIFSETEMDIKNIIFDLANQCCYTTFIYS